MKYLKSLSVLRKKSSSSMTWITTLISYHPLQVLHVRIGRGYQLLFTVGECNPFPVLVLTIGSTLEHCSNDSSFYL